MSTNKDRIEFAAIMARETTATTYDLLQVIRNAKAHYRLCEAMCNRGLTTKEEQKLERLKQGFQEWAKRTGCTGVVLSQDPRGCTVKLQVKSGLTNDWGKDGICVPQ